MTLSILKDLSRLKKWISVREKGRQVIEYGETILRVIKRCRSQKMIARERIENEELVETLMLSWFKEIDSLLNDDEAGAET